MKEQAQSINNFNLFHKNYSSLNKCNIYRREQFACNETLPSSRRSFYKIALIIKGKGKLYYADKLIDISAGSLIFFSPNEPYAWIAETDQQTGYFCTFESSFLTQNRNRNMLRATPFRSDSYPVYSPSQKQLSLLSFIFEQMLIEQSSDYSESSSILQNYIELVVHEGLKALPNVKQSLSSSVVRISTLFLDLLEQQFNDNTDLNSLADFAGRLAIHVNYLNRCVKKVTGKTSQQHINERKMTEAKSKLLQTSEHISTIAYSLGFNHPSNFNTFFKKHQGVSPGVFRFSKV